ncbi:MAG: hypothetical protein A3F68_05835 [Acidobacteria bacterium RIFCSPLOWO2_12_FULL_54_10]|nr:MAG: hypothetical protein A3F68_05835 [Acidobacteria bacterium RIFCSPLOWO2_12_FULL_54_10]
MRHYQLALRTPGISPLRAFERKHKRHILNFLKNARGRPHKGQRLCCRVENFALRAAFTLCESLDIVNPFSSGPHPID